MKRTWIVEVLIPVEVTVDDEFTDVETGLDALAVTQSPEWQRAYATIDKNTALGLLAYHFGIENRRVSNTDGWASLDDRAVTAYEQGMDVQSVFEVK